MFMRETGETETYWLADRLHKLPEEIRRMPARDLVGLREFYRVRAVLNDLAFRTEEHRRAQSG